MRAELLTRPVVAKGGGEVGANITEINQGIYGRLIRCEVERAPKLMVCSAPGKEPGVSGSEKLTDHTINAIRLANKPTVNKGEVHDAFLPVHDRFMSLAKGLNLQEDKYEALLNQLYDRILSHDAHRGEPEIIMAHILADSIPGGVFINPTNYLKIGKDGKFVYNAIRATRDRLNDEMGKEGLGIMPGFVVSGPDGRATTLSRGGSDASAGAISKVLAASVCIIYTNTEGVLSGDPRLVTDAQPIPNLTFRELAEATLGGTYVVHEQTIPPLEQMSGHLQVRHFKLDNDGNKTTVLPGRKPAENEIAVIVTGTPNRQAITVFQSGINSSAGFVAAVSGVVANEGLNVYDVATTTNSVSLTVDQEIDQKHIDISSAVAAIHKAIPKAQVRRDKKANGMAGISVVGENVPYQSDRVMEKSGAALHRVGVKPAMVSMADRGLNFTLYVRGDEFREALQAVHTEIINE